MAHQALEVATQERDLPLLEGIRRRITLYEKQKPFRESRPAATPNGGL